MTNRTLVPAFLLCFPCLACVTTARAPVPEANAPAKQAPGDPCGVTGDSALFADFVAARRAGREPRLPDFSYAGYHLADAPLPDVASRQGPFARRFVVTAYGAVPNDDGHDDLAVQAAIAAAEAAGGGVVFFPAGRYLLSPNEDPKQGLRISHSGVVLKGAGAGDGGTELVMDKMKRGFFIRVEPRRGKAETLATVVGGAAREGFTVDVADAVKLSVGQWIVVSGGGAAYNEAHWEEIWPFPETWSRMHKAGNQFGEIHQIRAIEPRPDDTGGARVHFTAPLHFAIKPGTGATFTLRSLELIEEIGIEDIRFTGKWSSYPETFVHHKDAIHDTAWSGLYLVRVANSWVRRCEFRDFNQSLQATNSVGVTFEALRFTGKKGHTSVHVRRGYGMLTKDSVDLAGHHHGPGLGYWGAGTVYLRHRMTVDQAIDSHSGSPYATLFDGVEGGVISGNGGPGANLPHHGHHLVFWNFVHRASGKKSYDFWSTDKRVNNTFARPTFAGFRATTPVVFADESTKVAANEAFGATAQPGSLFEAQLALRRCREQAPRIAAAPRRH